MTRRFLWALTALLTRAMSWFSLVSQSRASAGEQLLDDLGVGGREHLVLVEAARLDRRLHLEVVAHACLLLADLAGAGDLEALLRTGVRLLLGHSSSPTRM